MNEEIIKKIFYRFLKEEGAFIYYFKNLYEDCENCSDIELKKFREVMCHYPIELINYAFSWIKTPQGHHFWSSINNKWKVIYMKAKSYYYLI